MKVELQGAKVELEVGEGLPILLINNERVPVPREVGIRLIFGDTKPLVYTETKPTVSPKGTVVKAQPKPTGKTGCQSAASKRKLSESLRRFHDNRRKEEAKKLAGKKPNGRHLNGKLNGAHLAN